MVERLYILVPMIVNRGPLRYVDTYSSGFSFTV